MLQAVIIALVNTVAVAAYIVMWSSIDDIGVVRLPRFTFWQVAAALPPCAILGNIIPLAWWAVQRRAPRQADRSFIGDQFVICTLCLILPLTAGCVVFGLDPSLPKFWAAGRGLVIITAAAFFFQQAFIAAGTETTWWVVRRRRRRRGRCPSCDYDLAAGSDRCPECGEETPLRGGDQQSRR